MKSEIIFTGTELLLGQTLNTNSQYLQQALAALGIDLYYQVTVGDNKERLKAAILQASARADLIIIGGGLGPTEDDVSREALAEALGLELVEKPEARFITERFFKARGIEMSANNLKQALAPETGSVLDNPVGTAPGLALEHGSRLYVLLPGPPGEFKTMVDGQVLPLLKGKLGPDLSVIKSRVLKLCGIGESKVDHMLGNLLHGENPTLAPTAKFAEINLRITSKTAGVEEADRLNEDMEARVREVLGQYIYGKDDDTLPEAVGRQLCSRKLTLAVAETCSGGHLSNLLTSFPGSSEFFKLSTVSDLNGLTKLLGLKDDSPGENAATKLAIGIRELARSDIGVAITGADGGLYPSGGNDTTIVTSFRDRTLMREIKLWSSGMELRQRIAQSCLVLLWHTLAKM